ncbi:tetratricopeptide repeat protein 25-like [Stegodyphus dumicola]|uniref:tetratricopeptide repeat protein 25-like n=1 Tax=Stegodyphus dumicola TaxID=202533 RepID=UPI0015AA33AA|nr:tetratricopeptide repeat protein 25-like [Stegodyphus dumicola]
MDSEDEEEQEGAKGPKFPITMFISEGMKYLRCHMYEKAIDFFNKALEREPSNRKSLLGRGKCYLLQAKYSEAKEDAEAVLKSYPKSCEAKALKGEAEYFLGDFERGFLTFRRGYDARPNFEDLKLGHQMCRKAIDNSLSPDIPLIIDDKDIQSIEVLSKEDEDTEKMRSQPSSSSRSQIYEDDVSYLKALLSDDSISSIHEDCHQLLDYFKNRQIFWRTHKPNLQMRDTFPFREMKDIKSNNVFSLENQTENDAIRDKDAEAKPVDEDNNQENLIDEQQNSNDGLSRNDS